MRTVFALAFVNSAWEWVHHLGALGLILLGLADNAPFISAPAGSEDVFVILLAAHRRQSWLYYAFMATVGEVAGGYLAYRAAEIGGEKTLEKKVGKARAKTVYKWFEKHGVVWVQVGTILPPPFPFSYVLMAAGIMHCPRRKFLSALVVGRGARFLGVAYLGRVYGQRIIGFFSQYYRPMLYALIALAVLAGISALVYLNRRRRKNRGEAEKLGGTAARLK